MFGFFKKSKINENSAQLIIDHVTSSIGSLNDQMDLRFKEVSAQIREIELGLAQLETKLLTKDLKDKQAYGLLHYKLHEVKNKKLDQEIQELEEKIIKKNLQDQ
jgi:hypothetical protein